jgi:chitodextrinase
VSYPGGIKEYEIYRNDQSVGKRVGTSYSESNLSPETSYEYKVRAIANNGQISPFSAAITIETEPAPVEGD